MQAGLCRLSGSQRIDGDHELTTSCFNDVDSDQICRSFRVTPSIGFEGDDPLWSEALLSGIAAQAVRIFDSFHPDPE